MVRDLARGIVAMLFGLALYSVGVWGARADGTLSAVELGFMWAGLAADSLGTYFMWRLARSGVSGGSHSLTGIPVYLLMVFTAVYGSVALARGDDSMLAAFSRHAVWPWAVWVGSFVLGWIVSIPEMRKGRG